MASGLGQLALLIAALVALCGTGLIAFGLIKPPSGEDAAAQSAREGLYQRHAKALAGLKKAGLSGAVEIVDFGDGLGLGLTTNIETGSVIMSVPESLALSAGRTPSCSQNENEAARLDCEVERTVAEAVSQGEATLLTGRLALMVMNRRKGVVEGFHADASVDVLATLPETSWQRDNGLFTIDEDEFKIFGTGTSMEGWREAAIIETATAHAYITEKVPVLKEVSVEEVRWAYLMLQWRAQWPDDDIFDIPPDLELPPNVLFLWPLFLSRPTPEWQHGARLRHNEDKHVWEVVATHDMKAGDELHYVDRRLSDASVLCFQGLWLTARHRMRLSLNISTKRDPEALPVLEQYGCASQPLHLYVMQQKSVDNQFMSCMRLLALAGNASHLQRVMRRGWLQKWPVTGMIDQKTEATATEIGINSLQQVLNRLSSSSAPMKQRFGSDTAAARPTVQVREAETMIIVGLMKSMKELQLVASSDYLFEALKEAEKDVAGRGAR